MPGTPQSDTTGYTSWLTRAKWVGVHRWKLQAKFEMPSTPQSDTTGYTSWLNKVRLKNTHLFHNGKAGNFPAFYFRLKLEFRCLICRFISSTLSVRFSNSYIARAFL